MPHIESNSSNSGRSSETSACPLHDDPSRQFISTAIIDRSALFRAGLMHFLADSRFRIEVDCSNIGDLSKDVLDVTRSVLLISLDEDKVTIMPQAVSLIEQGFRVVLLTDRFCTEDLLAAAKIGAAGYLSKNNITPDTLVKSLELVLLGEMIIASRVRIETNGVPITQVSETESASAQSQPAGSAPRTDNVGPLSNREQTILMQLTQGQSNKHIARKLDISEATVKVHVKNLLRKIRVNNRTQAAMWAMNNEVRPNALEE